MQSLDSLYTHNSFQGIFQLSYNKEQFSVQNTFVFVTRNIQNWIIKKFGKVIPYSPKPFHWNRPSRSVDILYDYNELFYCARITHADSKVANRTWITEVEVSKGAYGLILGTKVQYTSDSMKKEYQLASIPTFVRNIHKRVKMYDAGIEANQLHTITSMQELEDLYCVLNDENRTLPVIVISEEKSLEPSLVPFFEVAGGYLVDGEKLSTALQFLAHIYYLPLSYQTDYCNTMGYEWGVYDGAIRTYYPGFVLDNKEDLNSYDHPFMTTKKILPMNYINDTGKEYIAGQAFRHILTHKIKLDNMMARYDWQKHDILLYYLASKAQQQLSDNSIDQLRELNDYYIEQFSLKEGECAQLEREKDEIQEQLKGAQSINYYNQQRIFDLEKRLKDLDANPPMDYPSTYEEVIPWITANFIGRIELHKRAVKCLKSSPAYLDVKMLCQAIEFLGTDYYDMKMGFEDRSEYERVLSDLKIENTLTGSEASSGTQSDEYFVNYQGGRRRLDMHVKGGKSMNSHDDRERFRIYYFWDDDACRIVIGFLPGHLHTSDS